MPTGCRLYRLAKNPELISLFHKLFLEKKVEYVFETFEDSNQKLIEMKLYCEPKNNDTIQFDIDLQGSYWNREEKTVIYKYTKSGIAVIFDLGDYNVLGLVAPSWYERRVIWAMFEIAQQLNPSLKDLSQLFAPIAILFDERGKEIQRLFPNITSLWIKEIQDIYVKSASIGGATVQASSEYYQFTRTKGGKLKALRFKVGAYTFLMSEDGLIMSYSDFDADQAKSTFGAIITSLKRVGAIK